MAVNKYNKTKVGNIQLSNNFTVKEFACNDGSNTVLIDSALVTYLQRIRNWANAPVKITSAYRTESYNRKVGGTSSSYHVKGQAADIVVSGKTPVEVAKFAQAIGVPGIGLYTASKFVHIDTRGSKYYWKNSGRGNVTATTHGGKCPYIQPSVTLKKGDNGNGVKWLQWWLNMWGYNLTVDGGFGAKTEDAVMDFQKKLGLKVDGLVGAKTRNGLKGFYRVVN